MSVAPQRALCDQRDECHRRVRLRAVDESDAFLRAENYRFSADLAKNLCGGFFAIALDECPLADERECEVRERRQVTARADASLLGNGRIHITVQHLENKIDQLGTRGRVTP